MISVKTLSSYVVPFGVYFIVLNFNVVFCFVKNPACWDFNFVPFTIEPGFSIYQQDFIRREIAKINKQTCLYWSDMDESESLQNLTRFVSFKRVMNTKCQTTIYYPLKVVITLADRCFQKGDVLHEIVHALGFNHEQKRFDRNCYVWVSESANENYNYRITTDFTIENIDKFPYDKQSIMHYSRSNKLKALSERFYEWEPLGKEVGQLSDLDLWKIQYRFCGRPHYCEVHPDHCRYMERMEADLNCSVNTSRG